MLCKRCLNHPNPAQQEFVTILYPLYFDPRKPQFVVTIPHRQCH